jgi:hypothetical protein
LAVDPVLVCNIALLGTNVDKAEVVSHAPAAQQQAVSKSHQNVPQLQSDGSVISGVQPAR